MEKQEKIYVIWVEFDDAFSEFLDRKCEELDKSNIVQGIRPPHMTLTFAKHVKKKNWLNIRSYMSKKSLLHL